MSKWNEIENEDVRFSSFVKLLMLIGSAFVLGTVLNEFLPFEWAWGITLVWVLFVVYRIS